MYEMRARLANAIGRCSEVEMSERIIGYEDSALQYADLIFELKEVKPWIEKVMCTFL
jgi:hypothetical protein